MLDKGLLNKLGIDKVLLPQNKIIKVSFVHQVWWATIGDSPKSSPKKDVTHTTLQTFYNIFSVYDKKYIKIIEIIEITENFESLKLWNY